MGRASIVLLLSLCLLLVPAAGQLQLRVLNAINFDLSLEIASCTPGTVQLSIGYLQASQYYALSSEACGVSVFQNSAPLGAPFNLKVNASSSLVLFSTPAGFDRMLLEDAFASAPVLPMDAASVTVLGIGSSAVLGSLYMTGVSEECYQCARTPFLSSVAQSPSTLLVNTRWPIDFFIESSATMHYSEHSFYTLMIVVPYENDTSVAAALFLDQQGPSAYIPLLICGIIFLVLAVLWAAGWKLYGWLARRQEREHQDENFSINASSSAPAKPKKERLRSLDAMRGLCISVMIFVNYGGGGYWFFSHSLWNGLTFADLVFPWFVFMMGVAMALSLDTLVESKAPMSSVLYKIVRRSVILFALGLFVNGNYDLEYFRVMGVLQRFGVTYLVVALILLLVPKIRPNHTGNEEEMLIREGELVSRSDLSRLSSHGILGGIRPYALEWFVVFAIVATHTLLTFLVPVDGCPTGYIGPGGLAENAAHYNCTGGAAGLIDRTILRHTHLYQTPTCFQTSSDYDGSVFLSGGLYDCVAYDPEGLLGCLTSVFLCFLGVQAGRFIRVYKRHAARIGRWLLLGLIVGGLGTGLAWARQDGGWIPINKNLWSLSFVLVLGGSGMWLLSLMYVLIDVLDLWNGAPFIYVGMNSITIYVASETIDGTQPGPRFPWGWQVDTPTHMNQLAQNVTAVAIYQLLAYYMFVCDFFLNV